MSSTHQTTTKLGRVLIATAALCLLVTQADAHEPGTIGHDVLEIDTPKISHAIYGTFHTGDEVFEVHLTFDEPFALPFEILVPHQDQWKNFRPAYAIIGPGLPQPSADERVQLPYDLPPGEGAYVELNDRAKRPAIFESFTRRVFWTSGPVALALGAHHYQILIWSPEHDTGDFSFGFGVEEGGDFTKAFDNWSTYAY